jgi:hypothetical protein
MKPVKEVKIKQRWKNKNKKNEKKKQHRKSRALVGSGQCPSPRLFQRQCWRSTRLSPMNSSHQQVQPPSSASVVLLSVAESPGLDLSLCDPCAVARGPYQEGLIILYTLLYIFLYIKKQTVRSGPACTMRTASLTRLLAVLTADHNRNLVDHSYLQL